jgi:hypothetical protein
MDLKSLQCMDAMQMQKIFYLENSVGVDLELECGSLTNPSTGDILGIAEPRTRLDLSKPNGIDG